MLTVYGARRLFRRRRIMLSSKVGIQDQGGFDFPAKVTGSALDQRSA
jgi:hypothetical protein